MQGFSHAKAPTGGYADEYAQLAGIADCMKESISFFKKRRARGIIIDVRFNSGGYDHIGMTVASHFFTGPALGFSKRSRLPTAAYAGPTGAQLEWTDFSIDSRFVGGLAPARTMDCPVAVLISGYTLSAAEVFTLMMQAHANCTFVGSPTCGCYSDILLAALSNGWSVGLSNQVYTNHRGDNYEGEGLAPDVPVGDAYPSAVELQEGRDDALAAAVGLLSREASRL
jgi:carboxyl-terminal processing protease